MQNASKINNIPTCFFYINICLEHCLYDVMVSQLISVKRQSVAINYV